VTAAFAPLAPNGGIPLPTPIQVQPTTRTPGEQLGQGVDRLINWGGPQGQALMALILRAAYLSDATLLSSVCPFIPGFVSFVRLADPALGDFKPVIIDCGTYTTLALHGIVSDAQYNAVALDLILPRYTAGPFQYLASVGGPGDWLNTWFADNYKVDRLVNLAAHSLGGVLGGYLFSLTNPRIALSRASYFGVPKLGPTGARTPLLNAQLKTWACREDPVIGLPPSYLQLGDAPFVNALFRVPLAGLTLRAIKVKLDAQWRVLESALPDADALNDDATVGELRNIDAGRNWYQRTQTGFSSLVLGPDVRGLMAHKISTYYNRLRALFPNWTDLSDAAGPGGRGADVAALAITAAELGGH
jgi:hypothetical protein